VARLVSVVLPTFNGERYLAESIESVLGQTHSNLELIIVDDCSTDSTPEIAARYAKQDNRVRVHRNAANQRLPRSLNIGFAMARGEYLTWTSDDNLYRPHALAELLQHLQKNPETYFVYSGMTLICDNGHQLRASARAGPETLPFRNPVGACFLYSREVYERVGDYDTEFVLAEDYDYWLRVAQQFRIGQLGADLYLYRIHPASLTGESPPASVSRAADRAVLRAMRNLRGISRREKASACRTIARRSMGRSDYWLVAKSLLVSGRVAPIETAAQLFSFARRHVNVFAHSTAAARNVRSK
jgi:glycosyltransferase involved in cell wall biosynthesis